jgi:K+-transporting ATPase ATPase C chain
MTILTGIIYPVFIFLIAKITFPDKSEGSFLEVNGKIIGSGLIAQKFDSTIYFQPRPSAIDFQPMPSEASNFGPTSKILKNLSDSLRIAFIQKNKLPINTDVPTDAIFSSGSGIDPHISKSNALLQSNRISIARKFDDKKQKLMLELIDKLTENPQYGFLGEQRINVLLLNIELDKL